MDYLYVIIETDGGNYSRVIERTVEEREVKKVLFLFKKRHLSMPDYHMIVKKYELVCVDEDCSF